MAYGTQATNAQGVGYAHSYSIRRRLLPLLPPHNLSVTPFSLRASGGYSTELQASCQNLPAGASCQFSSNPIFLPVGQLLTESVTVLTQTSSPLGDYSTNVVLTDGTITQQVAIPFNIGDFTMALTPSAQTLGPTDFTAYTLALQSLDGYGAAVQLGCSGLPASVICPVSGQAGYPGSPGTVYFQIHTQNTPTGTYNFAISGTSGPLSHSASAQLDVSNGTFTGSISPASATIPVGSSQTFNISMSSQGGFNGSVNLSCGTPPSGITCQFSATQVSVGPNAAGTANLKISVNAKPASAFRPNPTSLLDSPRLLSVLQTIGSIILALWLSGFVLDFSRVRSLRCVKLRTALAIVIFVLVAGLSSCGGGGGGGGNPATVQVSVQASAGGTNMTLGTLSITVP